MVFLADCERGLLPRRLSLAPLIAADIAEGRRLLFVGMTRARERLLLSAAARRTRHSAVGSTGKAAGRSTFLARATPACGPATAPAVTSN